MPNSPLLQIPQLAPNQTNKETTINDGFSIVERSLNDIKGVNLAAADVELNVVDYTRAFLFELTGHTTTRTLTVPATTRLFSVYNDGTHTVTVEAKDASGMTAAVPPGSHCVLFNNGEDVRMISDSAASGQVSAFLSLPDTPNSFAGHAGEAMVVNGTEDGITFGTISVSFTQLTDSPANYTGSANKVVRVNPGATGLTFADYVSTFLGLTDVPSSYTGQAGRMLIVNPLENSVVFEDVPEPVIQATRVFSLPNAGFESDNFDNWIVPTTSAEIWLTGAGYGLVGPFEGSFLAYFESGQGDLPTAIAYEVDLTDQAYPEELDDDADIVVEVAHGSNDSHYGQIELDFFDEDEILIDTLTSPLYVGTTDMLDRRFRVPVPVGSRSVIIYLKASVNPEALDPTELDAVFDDLKVSLKLAVDQVVNFTQLFDTPLSYAGQGGKMVVVNGAEDALEFIDSPASISAFTDLVDTPANYTGMENRYVRVNSDGTGITFSTPSFLDATNTPNSFSGAAHQIPQVNSGENALVFVEFTLENLTDVDVTTVPPDDGDVLTWVASDGKWVPAPAGGSGTVEDFIDLDDVPGSYTGNGGALLAVTSGEDGLEFVDFDSINVVTVNTQTSNYQLALVDASRAYVRLDDTDPITLTVPANATIAIPVGSAIPIRQVGAGQVEVVAAGGVTINTPETLFLRKQGSGATLIKVATNEWDIVGDLELA